MLTLNVWEELGFRDNPFSTAPVPANEEGERLLVGRERELKQLLSSICSSDNHATIEGANGVGKTSLVGVASYLLAKVFNKTNPTGALFIPMRSPFQILSSDNADDFSNKFLLNLANEMIRNKELLRKRYDGFASTYDGLEKLDQLGTWLNEPTIKGTGVGLSVGGFGSSFSLTNSLNTGQGFAKIGLEIYYATSRLRGFRDEDRGDLYVF